MAVKTKKYVRIDSYSDLLMPLEVFERVADQIMFVRTAYEDGATHLTEITEIDKFHLHTPAEVENLLMHDKLSKSND
tara:strand:+ start:68 stop:298 length:231 start_codon:yes stop_codon:yes gene_type:complete